MGHTNLPKKNFSYNLISKYRGVIMGFSIIAIMFFHFTEDCYLDRIHYGGFIKWYYLLIGSGFVDVFLLLSSFGLYYSLKKRPVPLGHFYQKRLFKVIVPYLICAMPALIWRDVILEERSIIYCLSDILFITFFHNGRKWFWYILAICLCYCIFPYIFQTIEAAQDDISAQMRMLIWFCFFNVLTVMASLYAPEFFNNTNILLLRLFPFALGTYLGKAAYEEKTIHPAIIFLCFLSIPLLYLRKTDSITIIRYCTGFFSIFISFVLIVVLEFMPRNILKDIVRRFLDFVGNYTLELYLAHVMIRGIMRYIGYPTSSIRNEAIMISLSIIYALLLKRLTNGFFKLFNPDYIK